MHVSCNRGPAPLPRAPIQGGGAAERAWPATTCPDGYREFDGSVNGGRQARWWWYLPGHRTLGDPGAYCAGVPRPSLSRSVRDKRRVVLRGDAERRWPVGVDWFPQPLNVKIQLCRSLAARSIRFFFLDHVQNKNHYAQCLFLTKGKKSFLPPSTLDRICFSSLDHKTGYLHYSNF